MSQRRKGEKYMIAIDMPYITTVASYIEDDGNEMRLGLG
jgi:hypothetical protein